MNPDVLPDPTPLDDAQLGRLVKDVAADWTMPPVRLDQPGWRERLRSPRERRATSLAPWGRRLAGAVSLALVLTIAVALVGVWLSLPRASQFGNPGDTPTSVPPTAPPTSGHTAPAPAATSTGLPALFVDGSLPSPSKLVVELEDGSFAIADLAQGKLGNAFTSGTFGSAVRRAPDGSLYCVCVTYSSLVGAGTPSRAAAYFIRFDADGGQVSSNKLDEFAGQPDPRDPTSIPAQPDHVRAVASFGDDPKYAFVGWSERAHPVWRNGLIVVDVAAGAIAGRIDLPDTTDGDGDARRFTDAPQVVGGQGDSLVIGRDYYTFPVSVREPNFAFNTDAYTYDLSLPIASDTLPTPIAAANGCGDYIELAGLSAAGGSWMACPTGTGMLRVRRVDADGQGADVTVSGATGIDGSTVAASPDGQSLYAWDPLGLVLTRVDLATGNTDSLAGPKPTAVVDPLTALGRWLVPSAHAKMLLRAGIAVAADGKHVYTIGIDRSDGSEFGNSAGLFDFSVDTQMSVERWDPTADFVSVAVSADGRFVYAAGMATPDPSMARQDPFASITVYDADTGKVRLVAGQLSQALVTFAQAVLP